MNGFAQSVRAWFSSHPDLAVVLGFGAAGGLLATIVQALLRHDGNLVTFAIPWIPVGKALLYALLGAIAAGFSVYIAANSKLDDLKRLTFFALLCGITFPAILVKSVDQTAERAQEQLALGKKVASDSPEAAETVTSAALQQAPPADKVDLATRIAITADTNAIIKELQKQGTPESTQAATNIFETAKDAGYINPRQQPPPQPPAPE